MDDTALVEITVIDSEGCVCGPWGGIEGDGVINPVDVVYLVDYVYKGWDHRVQLPVWPYEAGDGICEGQVNPVDAVLFVTDIYKTWDVLCPGPCQPWEFCIKFFKKPPASFAALSAFD